MRRRPGRLFGVLLSLSLLSDARGSITVKTEAKAEGGAGGWNVLPLDCTGQGPVRILQATRPAAGTTNIWLHHHVSPSGQPKHGRGDRVRWQGEMHRYELPVHSNLPAGFDVRQELGRPGQQVLQGHHGHLPLRRLPLGMAVPRDAGAGWRGLSSGGRCLCHKSAGPQGHGRRRRGAAAAAPALWQVDRGARASGGRRGVRERQPAETWRSHLPALLFCSCGRQR